MTDTRTARPLVLVVGGGITGLAAAHELTRASPPVDVVLIEAGTRLGGKVSTRHVEGFVLEGGPDSLPPGRPDALRLAESLGVALAPALDGSPPRILVRGRSRAMPGGLGTFLPRQLRPLVTTRLFSPAGKARMALEYVVPPRRRGAEETVEQFTRRRLGRQAYRRLVEPVTAGLLCGDASVGGVAATLPHLHRAELAHGGLVRSIRAGRRRPAGTPPAGPVSPVVGMAALVDALQRRLSGAGVEVRPGTRARRIRRRGDRYVVDLASATGQDGSREALVVDAVILAVPAQVASSLLTDLCPGAATALAGVPHLSLATVNLGYRATALHGGRNDATGHLLPPRHSPVRAVVHASARFAGRAPQGHVLIRCTLNGPQVKELDDEAMLVAARRAVATVLGVSEAPVVTDVQRWDDVIPLYAVGHRERVTEVEAALAAHPGLTVAGSALHGTALADCVASAGEAARAVLGVVGASTR